MVRSVGVSVDETTILEEFVSELTDDFPPEMVRECLDELEVSEPEQETPREIIEIKDDYETLHVRLMIYQLKSPKKRDAAMRTLTQNKSNLNAIFPEKTHKKLIKELKKLRSATKREYEEAYCFGLIKKLEQGVEKELQSNSTPATKYSRLHTARLFLQSLGFDKYLNVAPFNTRIKVKEKRRVAIFNYEFQELIQAIKNAPRLNKNSEHRKLKDLCYFMLMRNAGAMPHELAKLKYSDFDEKTGFIKLRDERGKERRLPLDDKTRRYLIEQCAESPNSDKNQSLLKGTGPRYMRCRFEMYAELAGLERNNLSPKSLRYAFAKQKIRRKTNRTYISKCLGMTKQSADKIISFYKR